MKFYVYKITRSEIMSLGCLWEGVTTRKLQELGTAKKNSLFGKLKSIKSNKKEHPCAVMGELNDETNDKVSSQCNFRVRYSMILVDALAIYWAIKFINDTHR